MTLNFLQTILRSKLLYRLIWQLCYFVDWVMVIQWNSSFMHMTYHEIEHQKLDSARFILLLFVLYNLLDLYPLYPIETLLYRRLNWHWWTFRNNRYSVLFYDDFENLNAHVKYVWLMQQWWTFKAGILYFNRSDLTPRSKLVNTMFRYGFSTLYCLYMLQNSCCIKWIFLFILSI